ncbi:MAG: hypothetical protein HGGPFJEG_02771 [Ignavibacteria bacterium]|nr:hypothetical protein [Ignavibacteria bacterium]
MNGRLKIPEKITTLLECSISGVHSELSIIFMHILKNCFLYNRPIDINKDKAG